MGKARPFLPAQRQSICSFPEEERESSARIDQNQAKNHLNFFNRRITIPQNLQYQEQKEKKILKDHYIIVNEVTLMKSTSYKAKQPDANGCIHYSPEERRSLGRPDGSTASPHPRAYVLLLSGRLAKARPAAKANSSVPGNQ